MQDPMSLNEKPCSRRLSTLICTRGSRVEAVSRISASANWSLHPNGANFGFVDGSVRFLRYGQVDILPLLATRADGEIVSFD